MDAQNSKPLVTIGLPVYNGGEALRRALDCLLAQSNANFELLISDNASTDGLTEQITNEYRLRDSRIRLVRQPVNLGAQGNFIWLAQHAKGDYFMWAAHDDFWSPNYVEVLADCLTRSPNAVLATGFTIIEQIEGTKKSRLTNDPAPNADRWTTVDAYTRDFACVWCYGLFRTNWVRDAIPQIAQYPLHYGDVIWLFGMLLENQVVGDDRATFHYTQVKGKYKEKTYRRKIELWANVFVQMSKLAWTRLPPAERLKGLGRAWYFVYRHHIQRGNPIGTAVRVAKLALIWTWLGIEAATRRLMRSASPVSSRDPLVESNQAKQTVNPARHDRKAA